MTGLTNEEVSTRHLLVSTVIERLSYIDKLRSKGETFTVAQVSALIVDDLMASPGMAVIIERTTMNGLDSGHEQGIREALTAVEEMNPGQMDKATVKAAIQSKSKRSNHG
jgi:hypothetical protein